MLTEPRGEEPLVVRSTEFADAAFGVPCGCLECGQLSQVGIAFEASLV